MIIFTVLSNTELAKTKMTHDFGLSNICPSGSIFVRMIPSKSVDAGTSQRELSLMLNNTEKNHFLFLFLVGYVELNSPSGDKVIRLTLFLGPFRIKRDTDGPGGNSAKSEFDGTFPETPDYFQPLELVLECKEETFDIYINGDLYLAYAPAHGEGSVKTIPVVSELVIDRDFMEVTEVRWSWGIITFYTYYLLPKLSKLFPLNEAM